MSRKTGDGLKTPISLEMGFSFHTTLANNLGIWKSAVKNQDIDCAIIVDGKEGSGKSVLAMQIGYFLDKDNEIDIETHDEHIYKTDYDLCTTCMEKLEEWVTGRNPKSMEEA